MLTRGLAYAYSWHPCAMYWICSRWGPIWAGFIVSGDGSNLVGGLSHPTKPGGGSSATSMGWPTITNHNGSTIAWWFYDFPSFSQLFPSCLVMMTQVMTPNATTQRNRGWDYLQHLATAMLPIQYPPVIENGNGKVINPRFSSMIFPSFDITGG